MKRNQRTILVLVITVLCIAIFSFFEVSGKTSFTDYIVGRPSTIDSFVISSKLLSKDMPVNVYMPKGYADNKQYPVLYMLHGFGLYDTEKQWLPTIFSKELLDEMIQSGKIEPAIIVSPKYDASCGYNTAMVNKAYDNTLAEFSYGRYEDYIVQELIPYIDTHYSSNPSKETRFIGGFSGGGNAALFLGFKHSNMFSKIGAHCPGLNTDVQLNENPDLKNFLFPTLDTRKERDPVYLAKVTDLADKQIYIDSVLGDRWLEGSKIMYETLKQKDAQVEYYVNKGYHSPQYLKENAEKYLLFYIGKK